MSDPVEHVKLAGDALSIGTVVASLAGWLPEVAAALSIVWTAIRIYETKTVQKIIFGEDAKK